MPRTKPIMKREEMEDIINRCEVCYLGIVDENHMPYVLPFNFGYAGNTVYLHSAQEGRKMDIMRKNNHVCIAFSIDNILRFTNEEVACSYGMKYRSVQVFGKVEFIEDYDEKIRIMNIIMEKYTGKKFSYNPPSVREVAVYKVVAEKMTGRQSGY